MAPTAVQYDITDFPASTVYPDSLMTEINADAAITVPFLYTDVEITPGKVDIWFDDPLPAPDQAALDAVVASHNNALTAPVDFVIYARSGGNDTTGTGTLQNPYATVRRALEDVSTDISPYKTYTIDCTGVGTQALTVPLAINGYEGGRRSFFKQGLNIEATPAVVANLPNANVTGSTPDATTGMRTWQTDQSYTLNEHKGRFVATSGGQFFPIASNTAGPNSSLELATTSAPGGLGDFTIVEASCVLELADPTSFDNAVLVQETDTVRFFGLKFRHQNTSEGVGGLLLLRSMVNVFACQIEGLLVTQFSQLTLLGGTLDAPKDVLITGGTMVLTNVYFDFQGADAVFRNGGDGATQDMAFAQVILENSDTALGNAGNGPINSFEADFDRVVVRDFGSDGIVVPRGGRVDLQRTLVENCSGNGVRVQRGYCAVNNLDGTGNGGFGLLMEDGAEVSRAGGTPEITGTGGDVKVGGNAVTTWGALGADVTDLLALAPELCRIHT